MCQEHKSARIAYPPGVQMKKARKRLDRVDSHSILLIMSLRKTNYKRAGPALAAKLSVAWHFSE